MGPIGFKSDIGLDGAVPGQPIIHAHDTRIMTWAKVKIAILTVLISVIGGIDIFYIILFGILPIMTLSASHLVIVGVCTICLVWIWQANVEGFVNMMILNSNTTSSRRVGF